MNRRFFKPVAAAPLLGLGALLVACLGGTVPLDDDPAHQVSMPISARPGLATFHGGALEAVAHLQAPQAKASDLFGTAVALSRDGSTLAVSAELKAPGRNGWSLWSLWSGEAPPRSGTVHVYTRTARGWVPQAQLAAQVPTVGAGFGFSLALSDDGHMLVVGAPFEIAGADANPGALGAVHVWRRDEHQWSAQARLPAPSGASGFGVEVSLSGRGDVLAVATLRARDDGDSQRGAGQDAVHVFGRDAAGWAHRAALRPTHPLGASGFGASVALSGDGGTIAVGAPASPRPYVHLFRHEASGWLAQDVLPGVGSGREGFGAQLGLSHDGGVLVVGAPGAVAAEGAQQATAGAAHVFVRQTDAWRHQARLQTPASVAGDGFGGQLALSANAQVLAVGTQRGAGAVHLFGRDAQSWKPRRPVRSTAAKALQPSGSALALSGDGRTLAVGDRLEDGGAPGASAQNSGAVRLYAAR